MALSDTSEESRQYNGFSVHHHVSSPRIDIKRINFPSNWFSNVRSGTELPIESLFTFGVGAENQGQINQNLMSYTFNRDVKEFTGTFEVQVKEDYSFKGVKLVLETVKPFDLVYIYETNKNKPDFIGMVETISFGATAGAYNKIVSISGRSVGKCFEDYRFSTDATNMAFFQTDAANTKWADNIINMLQENATKKINGVSVCDAMAAFWTMLFNYSAKKEYARISTVGLISMEQKLYGEHPFSISPDNVRFNYQICNNFFSSNEIAFIDTFKQLLPDVVYEMYDTIDDEGKPKVMVREKPFDYADWKNLEIATVDPSLLTDYTFTRSNQQVYSCFLSMLEGSALSKNYYITSNSTAQGNNAYDYDTDKMNFYGFKPLTVNFVGYARNAGNDNKTNAKETLGKIFKKLSSRLKSWYSKLDEMYSGNITMINVDDAKLPKFGNRMKFCGAEFYVTGETHRWQYGDSPTVSYQVERGGVYTADGFSPLKTDTLSTQFAELLKKE